MSLFGSSPSEESAMPSHSKDKPSAGSSGGLFDEPSSSRQSSNGLFDADGDDSPWSMPAPRKQKSRADMVRNLLPGDEVPESYIETFETMKRESGKTGINSDGVYQVFAAARLHEPATQKRIMSLVAPDGLDGEDKYIGRDEFNVLLALVGLAQEGEVISLDGVDERRRSKYQYSVYLVMRHVFLYTNASSNHHHQCCPQFRVAVLIGRFGHATCINPSNDYRMTCGDSC